MTVGRRAADPVGGAPADPPVGVLAAAAEALGRDVNAPPLPEDGPLEVATAAAAFNTMAARIRRFVQDRTELLTAIGHDLRTPITRLKLRAEFMEDEEQRRKMLSDLDELEAMVSATLAFGRDATPPSRWRRWTWPSCCAPCWTRPGDACPDAAERLGYDGPAHMTLRARSLALKRALANLVTNAVNYGGGALVRLAPPADGVVRIDVDDDGPGIPPGRAGPRVRAVPPRRAEPQPGDRGGGARAADRPEHPARPWRGRDAGEPSERRGAGDGDAAGLTGGVRAWEPGRLGVALGDRVPFGAAPRRARGPALPGGIRRDHRAGHTAGLGGERCAIGRPWGVTWAAPCGRMACREASRRTRLLGLGRGDGRVAPDLPHGGLAWRCGAVCRELWRTARWTRGLRS